MRRLCLVLGATFALTFAASAQAQQVPPHVPYQVRTDTAQAINAMMQQVVDSDFWVRGLGQLTDGFIIWEDDYGGDSAVRMPAEANTVASDGHGGFVLGTDSGVAAAQRQANDRVVLQNAFTGEVTTMTRAQFDAFLAQNHLPPRGGGSSGGGSGSGAGGDSNSLVETHTNDANWDDQDLQRLTTLVRQLSGYMAARNARGHQSAILDGGTYRVAELLDIYAGYDPFAHGIGQTLSFPPGPSAVTTTPRIDWYSPSAVGNSPVIDWLSPSAVGNSLPIDWYLPNDFTGPLVSGPSTGLRGPYASLAGIRRLDPSLAWQLAGLAQTNPDLARSLFGPLWSDRRTNPWDNLRTDGGSYVGNTSGLTNAEYLRLAASGDLSGLQRLLAQPFNILITWGGSVFDIDLHMTGPDGGGGRFHIYYAAPGSLTSAPFAQLIRDCVCSSGSEVILTSNLLQGGVYRISAFNFGDQSSTSTGLSTGGLTLQVVRGGTPQGVGQGTTIVDGHVLFTVTPPTTGQGNTWEAVEIDPATGRIYSVNRINTSSGSGDVR